MDRPLRVLWLIKGLGPGGAEHLLVAAARTRDREQFAVEAAYLLPWKDALVGPLEELGVEVECFSVRHEQNLRWVAALRRRLRDRPVDIVHVHSPYVAAWARLAILTLPARARPAVVSTEHNAWSTFKAPTRLLNAWTARFDDATIAVSEETRPRCRGRPGRGARPSCTASTWRRYECCARNARPCAPSSALPSSTVLVGTVANYHPKKDWPNLLRAARIVADADPAVRFLSVGQGPLQSQVETLHRELDLEGVVTLTGHRPDATRLMAACDLFALASQWEGLPVAVMEALALGLPIVATAVGGVAETFTDGVDARLVPPGDPAALADAILDVAHDESLRTKLAAAASARAEEFDAARAERRIEEIYRTVARAR